MKPAQSEQTTIGAAAALQTPEQHQDLQGGTFAGGANLKGTFDGSIESLALEASTDYR
jgi:hypothetical protein